MALHQIASMHIWKKYENSLDIFDQQSLVKDKVMQVQHIPLEQVLCDFYVFFFFSRTGN